MQMYGFGFPGQGFHCLKIPGFSKQQKAVDNVGLIRIKSGKASVEKVDKELQNLIDKDWVWRVRQVAEMSLLLFSPTNKFWKLSLGQGDWSWCCFSLL
jgi:hypothetical protein